MSTSLGLSEKSTNNNVEKELVGTVISAAMDKTAVVVIERQTAHPVYGKIVRRTTKYYVHDEDNKLNKGDVVKIRASRPISKKKRWVLTDVVETASSLN